MASIRSLAGYLLMPGLLMVAKQVLDFESPDTLLYLRAATGACVAAQFGFVLFLYVSITTDSSRDKVIFVKPSQLTAPEFRAISALDGPVDDSKQEMTHKEYDKQVLWTLVSKLATTTAISAGIHLYFGLVPILIVMMVVGPRLLYDTPFFRLYVKKQDPNVYRELRRPFPDPKPTQTAKMQQKYADWVRSWAEDPSVTGTTEDGGGGKSANKSAGSKKARRKMAAAAKK